MALLLFFNLPVVIGILCISLICSLVYICYLLKIQKSVNEKNIFEEIVNVVPESMFVLDDKKKIIGIYNATPAVLAGYQVSDIVGNHIDVYATDKNSPFYQACSLLDKSYDTVCQTDVPLRFEYMIGDSYLEATIKKLGKDKIVSIVRDISQLVRELHHYKKESSLALQAGGLSTWSYNAATKMFSSQSANLVIGKETSFDGLIERLLPEYRSLVIHKFDLLFSGKVNHTNFRVQVEDLQGNITWSSVDAIPDIYDVNGEVQTIVGSQKDVTEEVYAEMEKIRQREEMEQAVLMREKAEDANLMKSAFLANMSHEIRTPLNAIVGFSNLLPEADSQEEVDEFLKVINDSNELLLSLINDVLDLSRIEAGKIELVTTTFDMKDLLSNLAQSVTLKVHNQVKVRTSFPTESILITSDRIRLSQVITNFLNNAAKFTTEGSIELGCKRQNDKLYVYVEDTGIGIPTEKIDQIFGRFVKLNDFAQGSGLGLSIAKTIIELLDGQIGVESEQGRGSRFWFTLSFNETVAVAGDTQKE